MRNPLTLTALVAWLLLQVPMMFCQSECGQTVGALFLMSGHSCHHEESAAHNKRCSHHTDKDGNDEEDDGRHIVLRIQSSSADSPVELQDFVLGHCDSVQAELPVAWGSNSGTRDDAWRALDPPPVADPVSAADRLLV